MDPSQTGITFASLLTPQGVVVAATITTSIITLLRNAFSGIPQLANLSGALQAFVITAVLYVLAAVATGVNQLDAGFFVFMAWLSCATSAVGIHSTVSHGATEVRKRTS